MTPQLADKFRRWTLVQYRDSKNRLSINGLEDRPFLIFMEDGKIAGSGGCNRFFSSYEATETSLRTGLIGSTLMYCNDPPWLMDLEGDFFRCLEKGSRFELIENSLEIFDVEGNKLLSFKRDENWP
ncbi:MAG TPA: META domain-containing protein [Methanomassiliicoccales archaeon]|nr:META domain-containing protein [Methanomassiliicoccales archaeon]